LPRTSPPSAPTQSSWALAPYQVVTEDDIGGLVVTFEDIAARGGAARWYPPWWSASNAAPTAPAVLKIGHGAEAPFMKRDPLTDEVFLRVVGRRGRPPLGEPPSAQAQQAHASLLQYRTRAPKGIFIYRSHDEMEADRLRWTVDAMVERARNG